MDSPFLPVKKIPPSRPRKRSIVKVVSREGEVRYYGTLALFIRRYQVQPQNLRPFLGFRVFECQGMILSLGKPLDRVQ